LTNIYLSFGEIWNVSFHQFLLICLKFILQEVVTRSKWKRHAFFWDFTFPNIVPLMNGWTLLWTKNNMFQFFCNVNNRRVHCAWLKIAHFFQLEIPFTILTLDFQTKLQILCIRFYLKIVSEKTKQIKDDWACFGWMTMKITLLRWPLLFWFFSQKFWKELPTASDIMQMQSSNIVFLIHQIVLVHQIHRRSKSIAYQWIEIKIMFKLP
jgi:hypothetical protein